MPSTALNFVFATLVGMSAVLHAQDSRGPVQQDGVYLVPMSVSDERIAELQRYYRKELRLDGAVTEAMAYDEQGRCSQFERRRLAYTDAAGHRFERLERFTMAYGAASAGTTVRQVVISGPDEKRSITFDAQGYALVDSYGMATATEQRTTFERDESTDALRRVKVTCHLAGRTASATEDISPGANEVAIVERVRRACDVIAAKTEQ